MGRFADRSFVTFASKVRIFRGKPHKTSKQQERKSKNYEKQYDMGVSYTPQHTYVGR